MATIHYAEGFPTAIPAKQAPRLDRMLRSLGNPHSVTRFGPLLVLEWLPLYPGVPIPMYEMREPFAAEKSRIPVLSVTLS